MAKIPKPPKGGANRLKRAPQKRVLSTSPKEGKSITADMLVRDRGLLTPMMYSPGAVKDPEGMQTVPNFLEQINLLKTLSDVEIKASVFDKLATVYAGHQTYEECMEISHDNNVMILLEALNKTTEFSDMENEYDRGWINLLKILIGWYCGNPFAHDRIGYLMWSIAKHISPSCYFPLSLELNYDPRLWHRPGQAPKPPIPFPESYSFDGTGQEFGPEDDIWSCQLPNSRPGE